MINAVSITDLKQNTSKVIKQVKDQGGSIVIIQRSKAAAVLVNSDHYNALEEALENMVDLKAIEDRKNDPTVSFDDYFKKRFGKNQGKNLNE